MLTLAVDDRTPVRAPAPLSGCDRILTAKCLGCPNCLLSGRVLDQASRKRTAR